MADKTFRWALALVLTLALTIAHAQTIYHVAVDGSDEHPGTLDKPLATINAARARVRAAIDAGLRGPVTVLVHGGRYELDAPLVFAAEDSGTTQYAVTYKAFVGETPVISGGRIVKGWQKSAANRWTTRLPQVAAGQWYFRQLYADGQRLPRGRYPQDGMLRIKEVSDDVRTIVFDRPLRDADLGGRDVEVVVIQHWSIARAIITCSRGAEVQARTPLGWVGHYWATAGPSKPAFLENAVEFLRSEGQWHLDRRTGVLTYFAKSDENPNARVFVAPYLERLVSIEGSIDQPVRNLKFEGLIFEHVRWDLPASGYAGIQAGYNGTATEPSSAMENTLPFAIELQHARDCEFETCRIRHTGASGIGLGAGCTRNRIVGCEISDIGGNGIHIGPKGPVERVDADWADQRDVPRGNEIINCSVHHCGSQSFGAVGVFAAYSQYTRIQHNHVAFMPYTGVSIGFRWNPSPTSQSHCLVEFNHIHDVTMKLADGAAIYALGYQPGSVLRGNHIYRVLRSSYAHGGAPNNGIYLDEGSKGFLVANNVVYDTSGEPVRLNENKMQWHTWRDNHLGQAAGRATTVMNAAGIERHYESFLK